MRCESNEGHNFCPRNLSKYEIELFLVLQVLAVKLQHKYINLTLTRHKAATTKRLKEAARLRDFIGDAQNSRDFLGDRKENSDDGKTESNRKQGLRSTDDSAKGSKGV